jgi:hypothetical protein
VFAPAIGQLQLEPVANPLAVQHIVSAQFDARIRRQFTATEFVQLCRPLAVMAKKAADAMRRQVALSARVDHQRASPGPAKHQSGAQPGRAAADDDAVPYHVHITELAGLTRSCQAGLPWRQKMRKVSTSGSAAASVNCVCNAG